MGLLVTLKRSDGFTIVYLKEKSHLNRILSSNIGKFNVLQCGEVSSMGISGFPRYKMVEKSALLIGAGVGAVAVMAYCVYFDRKRRSDPNYKEKVRERRQAKKSHNSSTQSSKRSAGGAPFPDFKDPAQMQSFFLQEVQLGEELLAEGDFENAVDHLSNAVSLCGQPQQLLQILQQTLPPQVYSLLIMKLPEASRRIAGAAETSMRGSAEGSGGATVTELDLE